MNDFHFSLSIPSYPGLKCSAEIRHRHQGLKFIIPSQTISLHLPAEASCTRPDCSLQWEYHDAACLATEARHPASDCHVTILLVTTWGPVFTVNTKHYYLSLAWVSGKFRIGQIYECLFFIHIHRPGIVISLYVHWREGEVGGKEPDRHEPVATTGHVEGSIWDLIKWMNDLHRRYSIQ